MPVLAWRNDADGFAFSNSWTFDTTECATLTAIAGAVTSVAIAALPLPPDPFLRAAITAAAQAYTAFGPLSTYGLCGGMAYTSLDYWRANLTLPRGAHANDQPARTAATPILVRDMIWKRLLDSLQSGGVLQRTIEWSLLLNQVPSWLGGAGANLR